MPLFIDVHELTGVTVEQVADAHAKDVAIQSNHGVSYVKYWLNETRGKVFCLCTAPNAAAAEAGEPLERNGDFFGSTVQLAARLCLYAQPGETLVSASVVASSGDRRFADLGEIALKGFAQPVRAYTIA